MTDFFVEFVKALWIILPAYAANGFPTLAKGKIPMDGRKKWIDGERIFGDGKTIEGFSLGLAVGTGVGILEALLYPYLNGYANQFGAELPLMNIFIGFLIPLGALCGDLAGSFIKRRFRLPRGADAPVLDQLNFVAGAIFFAYFFTEISFWMVVIMALMTPVIHRSANIIAYMLKIKSVPW